MVEGMLIAPQAPELRARLSEASDHHGRIAKGLVTYATLEAEAMGRRVDVTDVASHLTTAMHTYTATITRMLAQGTDVPIEPLRRGLAQMGVYNPDAFRLAVIETELVYQG